MQSLQLLSNIIEDEASFLSDCPCFSSIREMFFSKLEAKIPFLRLQSHETITSAVWHEIVVGVYFCGLAIFCVLCELISAIKTGWFFLLRINFCDFRKYPVPSIDDIFVFIEFVQ